MADDAFDPNEFAAAKASASAAPDTFNPAEFASAKTQSQEPLSWSDVPGQALSNLPKSAEQFASNIAQPFIHPIETAEAIKNIGQGGLEKAGILSGSEHVQYANALADFFKERYGGMENFKKTMATDPVGFLADLSAVISGGETAAARLPGVVGDIAKAGTVSRTIDPVMAAKGAKNLAVSVAAPGSADARTLSQAGVQLTPGQMVGGPFQTAEEAVSSIPILGSFIKSGKERSIESFNKAVANQALEPIGESVGKRTGAGHDLVDEVATKLGNAYDNLVPRIQWKPDIGYFRDLHDIESLTLPTLPEPQIKQYRAILNSRLGRQAPLTGGQFKTIESELSGIGSNYAKSPDPAQRGLGHAINDTVMAMRGALERSNPTQAAELANINSGWAMYSRIRDAASRRATAEGVFTPSDLLAAVKKGDRSVGKGSFARGDALMQTFAETGQRVLPTKLPTSGTVERGLHAAALAEGARLLGHPELLAAGAAMATPYTRPGMAVLNRLYRTRPTQYIPSGIPQTSFQLGRLSGIDGQSRGGAIHRALRIAKKR